MGKFLLASKILAAGVCKLSPDATLLQGGRTRFGFYYDIKMSFQPGEEWGRVLEETIRGMLKEDIELESVEMVPLSASEYFRYHNQSVLAKKAIKSKKVTIPLCRWGEFLDLCPPFSSGKFSEKIHLQSVEQLKEKQVYRFKGILRKEKQKALDHTKLCRSFFSFSSDHEYHFLPLGNKFKEKIIQFWRSYLSLWGVDEGGILSQVREENGDLLGLFSSEQYTIDRVPKLNKKIFKQFIDTWDLEYNLRETPEKAEVFWIDMYGREHPGPWMGLKEGSMIGPIETLMALLIEKYQGILPIEVHPEPARLLGSDERALWEAKKALLLERIDVSVDASPLLEKQKIRKAFSEGILYVILMEKGGGFTLMHTENEEPISLNEEELLKKLKKDYLQKVKFL